MVEEPEDFYIAYDAFCVLSPARHEGLVGIYRPMLWNIKSDDRSNVFHRLVKPSCLPLQQAKKKRTKRRNQPATTRLSRLESLPFDILSMIIDQIVSFEDAMTLGSTSRFFAQLMYDKYTGPSTVGTWADQPIVSSLGDFQDQAERESSNMYFAGLPDMETVCEWHDLPPSAWHMSMYETSQLAGDARHLLTRYPWGTELAESLDLPRVRRISRFERMLYQAQIPELEKRAGTDWLLRNQTKKVYLRLKMLQRWNWDPIPRVYVDGEKSKPPFDLTLIFLTHSGTPGGPGGSVVVGRWSGDSFDVVPSTKERLRGMMADGGWEDATDRTIAEEYDALSIPHEYGIIWDDEDHGQGLYHRDVRIAARLQRADDRLRKHPRTQRAVKGTLRWIETSRVTRAVGVVGALMMLPLVVAYVGVAIVRHRHRGRAG